MPVEFGADEVRFDARARALEVSGHVHVDEPPFHFVSEWLKLQRVSIGVVLEGAGKLEFCPCLGAPLAVRFQGATLAPPHDVVLRSPTLEFFGVPVAWAPFFWLRSSGRVGLLPPEVAWRAADGLFLGAGVHVPWHDGDTVRGVDVRAGAYLRGGAEVSLAMRTTQSVTRVQWDWLDVPTPSPKGPVSDRDGGATIDARGATGIANGNRSDSVAWNVDALRGARAVFSTTDVDVAARPFDRAEAQAAWRVQGWTFASEVRTVALRGGDLLDFGAGGPVAMVRRADAIAHTGAYDATLEAGAVSSLGRETTTFARAEGGALFATRFGSVGGTLALRMLGAIADDGRHAEADGGAQLRGALSLPLVRALLRDPLDPLVDARDAFVHRTEPRVEMAAVATHTGDAFVLPAGRGMQLPSGGAWVAAAGWRNSLEHWAARESAELDVSGGLVGTVDAVEPSLRARAAASLAWFGAQADLARVLSPGGREGGAFVARARLGLEGELHVEAHVAERDGVDPVVARAIVDAPLEPAGGFLAMPGWTGGARVALPLGDRVTARGGADFDIDSDELVAALGAIDFHDPCNCVVVRASVAHRIGRGGVDAWLMVDLPH